MLTKILFTLLVVVGGLVYARHRAAGRRGVGTPARPVHMAPSWTRRLLPVAVMVAVMAVAGFMFWLQWQEEHRIFTVRVVDTRTGEVTRYAVYKDDVQGRSFRTVDGRVVTLADVERMELIEGAPKRDGQ